MCDSSKELLHTACRHEIAGIVTEVGSKAAQHFKVGDRAGVGCFVRACRVSSCKLPTASRLKWHQFVSVEHSDAQSSAYKDALR